MKTKESKMEKDLEDIKRLLVFIISKEGAPQQDIAKILGVDQSHISRSFYLHREKNKRGGRST